MRCDTIATNVFLYYTVVTRCKVIIFQWGGLQPHPPPPLIRHCLFPIFSLRIILYFRKIIKLHQRFGLLKIVKNWNSPFNDPCRQDSKLVFHIIQFMHIEWCQSWLTLSQSFFTIVNIPRTGFRSYTVLYNTLLTLWTSKSLYLLFLYITIIKKPLRTLWYSCANSFKSLPNHTKKYLILSLLYHLVLHSRTMFIKKCLAVSKLSIEKMNDLRSCQIFYFCNKLSGQYLYLHLILT